MIFAALPASPLESGVTYETLRDPKGPWVIHVVRMPRKDLRFRMRSVHATGTALGLATVTAQIKTLELPLAAINGDFYERAGSYTGDPRGLQIIDGQMISAPAGGPSFWIDALNEPQIGETKSQFEVSWGKAKQAITLNSYRETNDVVLFTPEIGASTRTQGGRELILERLGADPWLPLRPGRTLRARVREVREVGDSPLAPGTMVLSIGSSVSALPEITAGEEIVISTATEPSLRGVRSAISGGPILVRKGKRQRIKAPDEDSYEFSTMMERHPRSGIGWNEQFLLLVAVDGRQKGVSAGMTLEEFASRFVQLDCDEALNLDGGGSSTLWFEGKVRNFLCDGYEREIANALVVVRVAERKGR